MLQERILKELWDIIGGSIIIEVDKKIILYLPRGSFLRPENFLNEKN